VLNRRCVDVDAKPKKAQNGPQTTKVNVKRKKIRCDNCAAHRLMHPFSLAISVLIFLLSSPLLSFPSFPQPILLFFFFVCSSCCPHGKVGLLAILPLLSLSLQTAHVHTQSFLFTPFRSKFSLHSNLACFLAM
jgi:hypothetical protein